jgi:glutamine amidotransferase-like uncharacterized protein
MKRVNAIKIYKDKGVERRSLPLLLNELSKWSATFIASQEIIHSSWESDTSLLIMPGGRDVPFHLALQGEGNRRIRKYVENGGSFLGICAGAYYGCGQVEFDLGMELEVAGSRELAFFPGIARGPAYGPGTFRYRSEFGARAAHISNDLDEGTLKCYYNGGCYFVEAERYSHVKIISRYLDIESHPAAIIEIPVGKGKVILSGVHIEMGIAHQHFATFTQAMAQALAPYEEQRERFFKQLVCHLFNNQCIIV